MSIEKLLKPKPKTLLKEGVVKTELKGLFVGVDSIRIALSGNRTHELISATRKRRAPSDAKQAVLYLGSHSFAFGKKEAGDAKLSQLFIDFGLLSFAKDDIEICLDISFKDKYGDMPFSAVVEIVILYFK